MKYIVLESAIANDSLANMIHVKETLNDAKGEKSYAN